MLYNLSFIKSLVFIFSLFFVIENNIYSQEKKNFVNVKVVNPKFFVFKNEIKISGSIEANENVNITSVVSEKIKKIEFNEGSFVKKDDVLVVLENLEEQAQLKQVQAELEESEINFIRAQKLFKEGNTSQAVLDRRLKEKKKLEGRYEEVQAKINDLILKAPFDGMLGTKNFSEGAFLVPGDVVVSIYDIKQVKVKINIPEKYSNNLKIGQRFEAIIPSNKKEKLVGSVFAIDPLIDKSTRTFIVLGIIKNDKNRSFKPGMMVNVSIILESNNQLSIPEGCIIPEDDETFIFIVNNENIVIKKKIEIGKRKDGLVEVLNGLTADENVIFEGTNKVRNGTRVVINK